MGWLRGAARSAVIPELDDAQMRLDALEARVNYLWQKVATDDHDQ